MNKNINHRERMEICLNGEKTDRVPVALWRHFPVDDQNAQSLAAAVINFQNTFDFDFIKVTPSSSYCIKDWGVEDEWNGNSHGTRDYHKRPILHPEDWGKLKPMDPGKGKLGEMIDCLKILVNEFSPHTPVIQTIFSPLAQAKNLVGPDELLIHLRKYPEAVIEGLEIIRETTQRFIDEIAAVGIDGIFYAVQHSQYGLLSRGEFDQFGRQYDLRILNELPDIWLNVGHIHGDEIMFDLVCDYPVQILNWHDQETYPSLAKAKEQYQGVVCGGLKQEDTMLFGTPQQILKESKSAIEATNGMRFVLGTGCVLPITSPFGNIMAARQSVELK